MDTATQTLERPRLAIIAREDMGERAGLTSNSMRARDLASSITRPAYRLPESPSSVRMTSTRVPAVHHESMFKVRRWTCSAFSHVSECATAADRTNKLELVES